MKKSCTVLRNVILVFIMTLISNLTLFSLYAQGGAAINASGVIADPSAILDVSSVDKGVLIPRVDLTATTSSAPIVSPATSLMVYNNADVNDVSPGFYYWDGSEWKPLGGGGSSGGLWTLTNTSIHPVQLMDNVGIGTSAPNTSASLEISSTNSGLLIPRMTTFERDNIQAPAIGLQIFNLDCMGVDYWNGSCWLSMLPPIPHPGAITASSTIFCSSTTQTFSISPVTGATDYTWTVPPGATITSGQGTTSIEVLFSDRSGQVCVVAYNDCSSSTQSCINVEVMIAPTSPGVIVGPTNVAKGAAPANYYISPVSGATTYNWTIPNGANIISGSGTSSITVNYPCSSVSGIITVNAANACGASSSQSLLSVSLGPIANAGVDVYAESKIGGSIVFPTASGGTTPYTYQWGPPVNLNNYSIANPTAYCSGTTTIYSVTVTDAMGCTDSDSVVVIRKNQLIADAGVDVTLTGGEYAIIGGSPTASNASGPYTYNWAPNTGLSSTTVANPTVSVGATTTYTVTVSGTCGTSATSSVVVSVAGTQEVFNFTGIANEPWVVPVGVTSVKIEAWGAQGGGTNGGLGGYASMIRNVTPGETLYINVGGMGGQPTGGFNGGGTGGVNSYMNGDGGGGASDVRQNSSGLNDRIIIAGGGGGSGKRYSGSYAGGYGGFSSGSDGSYYSSYSGYEGKGGTQTNGGSAGTGGSGYESYSYPSSGVLGFGGNGAAAAYSSTRYSVGGGGGGGFYGGGGGDSASPSSTTSTIRVGGGGGGSSYFDGIGGTATSTGVRSGDGLVIITY